MIEENKDFQKSDDKDETKGLETNWFESVDSFHKLGLKEDVLKGIYDVGFDNPSQIQQRGIIPIIKGKDTIAQSQSGTGKTTAISISALQAIDTSSIHTQVLILTHSTLLAELTISSICSLNEYIKASTLACTGNTNMKESKKKLMEGVQIVVGSPGRVLNMIQNGLLSTKYLKLLIFDETDEILSKGFKDQIESIFQKLPNDIQFALFSVIMIPEIQEFTKQFMRDPAIILLKNDELTLDGIKQFQIALDREEQKFETLVELYNSLEIAQAIIYCNTKKRVEELRDKLTEKDITVSAIQGEMLQQDRDLIMKEFRTFVSRVLITTDLYYGPIDLHHVNLVINYDLPLKKESYIRRIGRYESFYRKGVAINFIIPSDTILLKDTEKYYQTQIIEMPLDVSQIYE